MARRSLSVFAAVLLIGLSLTACQSQTVHRMACPAGQRCLEYGNSADPTSLDPQIATATNEAGILRELFTGLYADGADGRPVLGVADHVETSPDGLTWTFHLRPWSWSDGQPLTADDFVYAYRHMLDPKTGSSYAYLLYVLKNGSAVNNGKQGVDPTSIGAKALDPQTLQLTLEHAAPYLPEILKHQAAFPIPKHLVEKVGQGWSKPGVMVSNGPYKLSAWRLGDYVRIDKNPRFAGDDKLCFDRVDFYPTQDAVAAERRVLRGELDINNAVQSNRVRRLRSNPSSAPFVRTHSYLSTSYLIFNRRDVPALKDVRVRQAISMAVDRSFIAEKLLGAGQVPTTAFTPSTIANYLPAGAAQPAPYWAKLAFPARQAEARRLLAAAGFNDANPLKLKLKTFSSPLSLTVAEALQADLKDVGIQVTMQQEDGIVALQSFEIRDFQIGIVAWIADFNDPMTFLTLMKSDTGAQNYGDFKSPQYDGLIDKADHEADPNLRAKYMAQAEQIMLDDADVAPIYNGVNTNLVEPHITGWLDNASDVHPIRLLCRNDAPAGAAKTAP